MKVEKPAKRMTLRELLTHAEKCSRDLIDYYHGNILPQTADFRDLNRPVRRRSHYPTLMALQNAINRLEESNTEAMERANYLMEQLKAIRDSASREVTSRI
jgi:hypothetical protein